MSERLEKLVVSAAEVASVSDVAPSALAAPQLAPAISRLSRALMAPLVLVLPLLSLATLGIWLATRRKEARLRHAWLHFCCALLVLSGLLSSIGAGFFFLTLGGVAQAPAVAWVPVAPMEFSSEPSGALLSPRELARRLEGAVFIVAPESPWRKPSRQSLELSGFGTGVLVFSEGNERLLATARHVLDGKSWEHDKPFSGQAVLCDRAGTFFNARIAGRHKSLDLLLLRLSGSEVLPAFTQPVLAFEKIAPGERIMIFGHPEGLFFSLADGLISRKDPAGRLQISAPVSPGASGGPVYDLHGQLLGIVSSMLDKRLNPHSENLNFAVRADALLHVGEWQMEAGQEPLLEKFFAATRAQAEAASEAASEAAAPPQP